MESSNEHKVWMNLKRLDLYGDDAECEGLYAVVILADMDGAIVRQLLREQFDLLHKDNLILRIRNHRGALVPVSGSLPANPNTSPYTLEVVRMYQNVRPSPRCVKMNRYTETFKKRLENILMRLERLEAGTPYLKTKREDRLNLETKQVDQKLDFLNKRFAMVDSSKWKGMFTKNPMW